MGFLGLGGEQAKLEINKARNLKQAWRLFLPLPEEFMTSKLFSNEHRTRALHLLLISLTDIHLNLKGFPGLGLQRKGLTSFCILILALLWWPQGAPVSETNRQTQLTSSSPTSTLSKLPTDYHAFGFAAVKSTQSSRFCKNTVSPSFYED